MASSLRKKLARRTKLNSRTEQKNARINTLSTGNFNYYNNNDSNLNAILRINNISTHNSECHRDRNSKAIEIFINAVQRFNGYNKKEDWNVGYNLWNALTQEQKDLITIICRESKNLDKIVSYDQTNQKQTHTPSTKSNLIIPKHLKITDSIVKPPAIKTETIPKQYSNINHTSTINEDEEVNNMSLATYVYLKQEGYDNQDIQQIAKVNNTQSHNTQYHLNNILCRANFQFVVRLTKQKVPLCITDGGADTHVFGRAWIPLFSEGPHTPKADIIGFDDKAARKHGLPIGPHATKVKDRNN